MLQWGTTLARMIAQDERDRARRMDDAWAAYYGRTPKVLKVVPGQDDDNVMINKARVVVDKGVSFLFGGALAFKLPDVDDARADDPDTANPAQTWLDACWKYNRQGATLHKAALNGGVCGHTFLKIVLDPAKPFPRLLVVDPATVRVVWQPDDIETVEQYIIQYSAEDPVTMRVTNYRQTIKRAGGSWVVIDEVSDPLSNNWHVTATTPWPHPWPPLIDCQNLPAPNEYWGISDIGEDVLGLQRAATFTLSNTQRIIRYHASPLTIAKGVGGDTINRDVSGVILLPTVESSLENLEMKSNLADSIVQYEHIEQAIHEVARVPAVSLGTLDSIGPVSGVALAILYQPLIEKTETKRLLYGDMLEELCRRLLDLGGYGYDSDVSVTWPELLPTDPLQERQVLLLEDQMGLTSKQTMAEKIGLDWEMERERMEAEHTDAMARAQADAALGLGAPQAGAVVDGEKAPNLSARADVGQKGL